MGRVSNLVPNSEETEHVLAAFDKLVRDEVPKFLNSCVGTGGMNYFHVLVTQLPLLLIFLKDVAHYTMPVTFGVHKAVHERLLDASFHICVPLFFNPLTFVLGNQLALRLSRKCSSNKCVALVVFVAVFALKN